jgi:hypothetical protein
MSSAPPSSSGSVLFALRAEHGWRNDPFRARWTPLCAGGDSGGTATVCAFSPRGRFLAVGHVDGSVRVWEVSAGARTLVRTLRPPAAAPALRGRGVAALAWVGSARLLLSASCGGVLVAHDVASGSVLRALLIAPLLGGAGGAPRALRAHPTRPGLAILVPSIGMPFLVHWGGGGGGAGDGGGGGGARDGGEGAAALQLSEALLPPPVSKKQKAALARRGSGTTAFRVGASALVTDAVWAPSLPAADAGEMVVVSSRGDMVRARAGGGARGNANEGNRCVCDRGHRAGEALSHRKSPPPPLPL